MVQHPICKLIINPPLQFPPLCPSTHIPHLPFYYRHTVPTVRLIKHETKQTIYIKSAVSQNSSSKTNYTGHCSYFSLAGSVCRGKRFTQGHPVSQQQIVKRTQGSRVICAWTAVQQLTLPRKKTCAFYT